MFRIILFAIALLPIAVPAQSTQYLWPTSSGKYLSSTFGETRSAHFHAGLDIKTWGREGYKVFASKKGKVDKIVITERGYGKAIYLKHSDNTYTVYAHLQRFNNELQAIADSIRLQNFSFEMEAKLDSFNIEVARGEVIGYTGSTGIGPPHLHFEIRDSLDNPINPLRTNLAEFVEDDLAPIFSSIMIEPLQADSRIEGNPYSVTIPLTGKENNIFYFGDVRVFGKVGLAVSVHDVANRVPNKYAVYTLSLLHQTDTLFYQKIDAFNFNESDQMFLDRIPVFGSTRRNYHRLFAKDGSRNPFYRINLPAVKIDPADTAKVYTIVATDYFGNTSKAEIILQKDSSATDLHEIPAFSNPLKSWYWDEDWASPDLVHTLNLEKIKAGTAWMPNRQLLYIDEDVPITLARIKPDQFEKVKTADERLLVEFDKNTFYDTLSVALIYKAVKSGEAQIIVQPQMLPAKTDYKLEFYMGDLFEDGNNYRLFRVKDDGELSYIDSELFGSTVHASPSSLGNFVIKADNNPPRIYNFYLKQTDYGQWLGIVTVKDELSGIDAETAEFRINGVRGIAEYDYEEEFLIYYLPGFIPKKENTVLIQLKDKAGNKAEVKFKQ